MKLPRLYRRIRTRLVVTYCLLTAGIFGVIGTFFYYIARDALDDEMGRRLVLVAELAASRQKPEQLLALRPGDEETPTYRRQTQSVRDLMELGAASRIYVFDAERKSLLDTDGNTKIGASYFRLETHRAEVRRAFAGESVVSQVFLGLDGLWVKSAFAPVRKGDEIVAALAVEADVPFFGTLARIKRNLLLYAIGATLLIVAVSVFLAIGFEKPIARLVQDARRLGSGDLETRIEPTSRDEIGFLAASLDTARQSIVERDRFLQMLQRGIAHEVRNPLGGMRLFCDILSDELAGDADKLKHVEKIRREIGGLENVVNEFLDFTRDVVLNPKPQSVMGFVRDLMAGYMDLEQKGVILDFHVEPPDLEATFDADRLRRALFNLVNNAIQAMPKGGRLTIVARREADDWTLAVEDTGVGIKDEDLQHLFTPFYTTKDKGTGLGMPLAKKIVESHRGTIQLTSRHLQGTRVQIRLPLTIQG